MTTLYPLYFYTLAGTILYAKIICTNRNKTAIGIVYKAGLGRATSISYCSKEEMPALIHHLSRFILVKEAKIVLYLPWVPLKLKGERAKQFVAAYYAINLLGSPPLRLACIVGELGQEVVAL